MVSVNTNGSSFVMQGPYGFQKTIEVNPSTQYNGSNSLSTLVADAIVSVIGRMQADGTILAKGVEQGLVRQTPEPRLAARLVVETIAWFAMHRHGDPDGRFYEPAAARATTLDALTHAYATHPTREDNR